MDKFLKIAGIVLVAWIALGLVGWVFNFLASSVFWIALIAGGVWLVGSIAGGKSQQVGSNTGSRLR